MHKPFYIKCGAASEQDVLPLELGRQGLQLNRATQVQLLHQALQRITLTQICRSGASCILLFRLQLDPAGVTGGVLCLAQALDCIKLLPACLCATIRMGS